MPQFETEFDRYFGEALERFREQGSVAARQYIEEIDDEDFRDRTFDRMAQFLAGESNLPEALLFCSSVKRPRERADALIAVGAVLRQKGEPRDALGIFDQAVRSSESVQIGEDRASLFLQIADEISSLGHRDKARALLQRAIELLVTDPQSFEAAKTLRGCARLLAMWDFIPEALSVAEKIHDRWSALRRTAVDEIRGRGEWPVRRE